MKKRIFVICIIMFLFLLNLVLCLQLVRVKEYKNTIETKYIAQIQSVKLKEISINQLIKMEYQVNSKNCKEALFHKFPNWKNRKMIILVGQDEQCGSCIKKILMDFALLMDITKFNNFVYLGVYNDSTKFYKEAKAIDNFNFLHESIKTTDISEFTYIKEPYVLMLDETSNFSLLYVPDYLPELRQEYFYKILPQYITK